MLRDLVRRADVRRVGVRFQELFGWGCLFREASYSFSKCSFFELGHELRVSNSLRNRYRPKADRPLYTYFLGEASARSVLPALLLYALTFKAVSLVASL